MLPLENGVLIGLQRRLKIKLNLPIPPMDQDQPDPVFLRATDWLLHEGGCDWLPNLATETRARPDVPARAALAELLHDDRGPDAVGHEEWEARVEPLACTYYEQLGYQATIAGALTAVCDLYFGRILAGSVHPAVGAGCIAWYHWMTTQVPDHAVVLACQRGVDQWKSATDRSIAEQAIRRMARAWRSEHQPYIPVVALE